MRRPHGAPACLPRRGDKRCRRGRSCSAKTPWPRDRRGGRAPLPPFSFRCNASPECRRGLRLWRHDWAADARRSQAASHEDLVGDGFAVGAAHPPQGQDGSCLLCRSDPQRAARVRGAGGGAREGRRVLAEASQRRNRRLQDLRVMPLEIVERPSPNHDARAEGPVDILVMHYTGMKTAEEALARLCDPEAKVSSHYTIDRDGTVYRHVAEDRRARHAGVSYWAGVRDVNSRSIGIEIVNPGHEFGYIPFAEPQIAALIDLSRGILERHPGIAPSRVV